MENRKICAAYIRVSTDEQLDYSPESQRKLLLDYAQKHNMVLPTSNIFTDDGISGRKAAKRPGFMALIAAAKRKPKPFEAILVWKFSRFARNQEESIVYKSMLRRNCGIEVISISEQLPDGEFGSLIERIIEWMDEYYSIRLSGEVRRGMAERVRQGEAVSPPPIGYAYREGRLVEEPTEATVVRLIFRDFLNGDGTFAIAKKLNVLGIRTKRGGAWSPRTVRYVLQNPVYIGKLRWALGGEDGHAREDYTRLPDGNHAPILSESDFAAAQERLEAHAGCEKSTPREAGITMLQGLVRCSACGGTIVRTGKGMNCVRYLHGKCSVSHYIAQMRLEALVLAAVEVQMPDLRVKVTRRSPTPQAEQTAMLGQQLRKEEVFLKRCREAYLAGIDTLEEYKENKASYRSRIEQLRVQLAHLQAVEPTESEHSAECSRPVAEVLRDKTVPTAEKNRLLCSIIDSIVFDNKAKTVTIVYRA